jgi:glycosyltransferase involved in cell wall biosynthesis
MQKTNFDFEVVIHDDASTDDTKEIIEEYAVLYPDMFVPMYHDSL